MFDITKEVLGVDNGHKNDNEDALVLALEAAEVEKELVVAMTGFEVCDRAVNVLETALEQDINAKGFESSTHEYDKTVVAVASVLGIDQDTVYAIESEGGVGAFFKKIKDSIVNFIKKIIAAIKKLFGLTKKVVDKTADASTANKVKDIVKKLEDEKKTKLDGKFSDEVIKEIATAMPAVHIIYGKIDGSTVIESRKDYKLEIKTMNDFDIKVFLNDLFKNGGQSRYDSLFYAITRKASKLNLGSVSMYADTTCLVFDPSVNAVKETKIECSNCKNVEPIKLDELKNLVSVLEDLEKIIQEFLKTGEKKADNMENELRKTLEEIGKKYGTDDDVKRRLSEAEKNLKEVVKVQTSTIYFALKLAKKLHMDTSLEKYINESVKLYK